MNQMIPIKELQRRFLKDPLSVRLGGVASDLSRLSGLASTSDTDVQTLHNVLTELKLFTEWAAQDADYETQKLILSLQRTISRFDLTQFPLSCPTLRKETGKWSKKILSFSGLTNPAA